MNSNILPVESIIPDLLSHLGANSNAVLQAAPGAGKTTRVPLALLKQIPPEAGRIVMLEPRRLAAVSAARWMSAILGEKVGQTVGYSVRFDSAVSAATRIEVVTEGVLSRRMQNDPFLEGVAVVIFDEFHERSIHADLGLALCLELQRVLRDDLKIIVMSATLDCQAVSVLLGNARVFSSAGRSYPVAEVYLEEQLQQPLPERIVAAVRRALAETAGDILVFLPGASEIRKTVLRLNESGLAGAGLEIHPLYADLPHELQQRAILPGKRRKVVLATSIAETSLTIEGVRAVIDCGLSRRLRHDPASGLNRLVTVRESRSSAEQRKGRGGRVAAGICYRLFSRHTFIAMSEQTPPEIMESDLSQLLLDLLAWGNDRPMALAWIDPPPDSALAVAGELLKGLGALDSAGRITPAGRRMASLPLHPRLGALLVRGIELGAAGISADLAAILSERPFIKADRDLQQRLELLRNWRENGLVAADLDLAALKGVERVAAVIRRMAGGKSKNDDIRLDGEMLCRLLLAAYPDRVARLRDGSGGSYLLSSGRGARLARQGVLTASRYIIAVSVDGADRGEGVIHLSVPLDEDILRHELPGVIVRRQSVVWDQSEGRIVALEEECLGALKLSARSFVPPAETVVPVLLAAIRSSRLNLLQRDERFMQLQGRLMLLHARFPDDGWPDFSDAGLESSLDDWLADGLHGVRNLRQLEAVDLCPLLLARLDYSQRRSLDSLAPTHMTVPSGSRIKIDYAAGAEPVLAVRLQEMFGLAETPSVAAGRVKLLLHLLSPAGRPLQVTRDLKGFWDGSYHQVKKEMKGRYPRHNWPDDPWSAPASRKVRSRL